MNSETSQTSYAVAIVYVPSSNKELLTVGLFPTDSDSHKLKVLGRLPLPNRGGAITAHPTKPLIYLTIHEEDQERIDTLVIDPGSRLPKQLASIPHSKGTCYLSAGHSGRFLFSVSYGVGNIDIYSLTHEGIPQERTSSHTENKNQAHSIALTRDEKFVYVPFVKDSNDLRQYRLDTTEGKLAPLDPPNVQPGESIGPRHPALHPKQPWLYFNNEQQVGVSAYRIEENGTLELMGIFDAIDQKNDGTLSASDIAITPDGSHLFSMVRHGGEGDLDQVVCYSIQDDGTLKHKAAVLCDKIPWSMGLSPDGSFLFLVASKTGNLLAYRILDGDNVFTLLDKLVVGQHSNTLLVTGAD